VAGNIDVTDKEKMNSAIYEQIADYCKDKNFVKVMNFKGSSKRI
jgi:hypothetical protein